MALDQTIKDAVNSAVREAGQSQQLATKLLAWIDAVISGNEDVHDRDSSLRHLELLFKAVELSAGGEE